MPETLTRMESFPFDSKFDGYDADGYPVYDRAVGAAMLRTTFEKFFSNGVFPSPSDAFQIAKAATGLNVTIQPGTVIINGAMGGTTSEVTLTLTDSAPQGNAVYGIMLRYDNTDDRRSIYLRVVEGTAGSNPVPPSPDHTTPGVYELRLGYVVVPSGATDLSGATVTNEKGLAVCPYAAPFEEIDTGSILADFTAAAQEQYDVLVDQIDAYGNLLSSALDSSTAGYLQTQINDLKLGMTDSEFLTYVLDQNVMV